jgi:hypothetical protein
MSKKIAILALLLLFIIPAFAFAGTVQLPQTGQTTCYDSDGAVVGCAGPGKGQDGDLRMGVPWPDLRFTESGDCVTDNLTGLMWTKNGNIPGGTLTWQEALDYVADTVNSEAGTCGHSDWRLPNVNELNSLVNAEQFNSADWLNGQGFANVQANWYWSSSTYAYSPNHAWIVPMAVVPIPSNVKSSGNYVWPVRGGQLGALGDLNISFSGSGSGTVNGDGVRNGLPSSYSTNTGTTEQFDIGTILQLHGDPDDYNIFTGWSGDCSGKTDCNLTMTASRTVNAIFDIYADHKARIGDSSSYYTSLQAAYDNSPDPGTIKAWATEYVENLRCNQVKNVTMEGGYNEGYTTNTGYTTLKGNLTIANGSLICDKLIISACNGSCSYYSISGRITYNGTGLGGVSVRLSGASASLLTTDTDGNYAFTGLSSGTYTVTPSLAGYTITPQQTTISSANVTLNFTAAPITYSISGRITYNSTGLSGVAVALTGASTANTTTDSSGNYSFTGLANGTYTVTPTLAGYTITPQQVSVNGSNVTTNFTATYGYSITGRITLSGTGFSGVSVALTGTGTANTTTDSNGDYSFTGLSNGSYTITPSLTGYLFTPSNLSATVSNANVTGKNFTATLNSITHPSSLVGTWSSVDHYTEDSDGEAPYTETGSGTLNADGTTNNGTGAWAVYKNIMAAGDFYNEVDGKGISCNYLTSVNSPLSGYFEEIDLDYYWWGRGTGTATKINSSGGSDQLHLHPANLVGNWSVVATYTSTSSGTPNSYNSTETVTLNSNGTVSSRGAVIGFWFSEGGSVGDVFGVGYFWDKAAESGFKFNFMNLSGTTSASGYIEDKKLTGSLWWGRGNVSMTKQ